MKLSQACTQILGQLVDLVEEIDEKDFSRPSHALSNSTIGQHLRHTLEFFFCLESGFEKGVVNYDKRAHDKKIETDRVLAINALNRIIDFVNQIPFDKPLKLEVGYDTTQDDVVTVETNTTRELVYNIEHAVHHMAIMKIGIREVASYIMLPADFGIAASTLRYNEAVAQSSH
ncbi:DinB family protein [Chryseosolibacter indicus]|uniref:DinB family protein n=1 Tax=Chryseosolibacter indicus TaxID=2782351 RepID=A0ABS5VXN2_9BACT|nr:DinB family protein [Chryseosolibacter indicus]MBT1706016.1 hypothetical protein [Chryseosolibacter indicus]